MNSSMLRTGGENGKTTQGRLNEIQYSDNYKALTAVCSIFDLLLVKHYLMLHRELNFIYSTDLGVAW